ncbi:KilA-N domain-containing protein [Labrenzia sp. CE80]|uniref:KilA-N domain-containing protein n=1 Tax=Labrenzia sp. CE80 TaxID=1788986 RepID=UPI00129BD622|nr:KilA-N domain-containing protein [Labrenzia sp. CE80]
MQQHFELISHEAQGEIIYQRPKDGYINATAMCQAAGKSWFDYRRLKTTDPYINELASETGIPGSELIQSLRGGDLRLQGTWVHPQVAVHLAQWLSAEFAVKVSKWVFDWMSGKGSPVRSEIPYHLRRYVANQPNVPIAHFSILTEMTQALIAPLEIMGYSVPESMMPDISHGRMFCKWLREAHGIDTDALPTYTHVFEDGRKVPAKAYPELLLHHWRRHFREEWLPNRAVKYFSGRDSAALEYLPKLLPAPVAA